MIHLKQTALIHAPIQRCFDLARSVEVHLLGVWQNLTSRTTALTALTSFQVTMTRGIFREMQADHLFRTLPSGATEMRDLFRIAAPSPSSACSPRSSSSAPPPRKLHQAHAIT